MVSVGGTLWDGRSQMARVGIPIIGLVTILGAVVYAQEGRKITGVVEDADSGRGIAGAEVRYEEIGLDPQTTRTGSAGEFEIPNASSGGIVTVIAENYAIAKRSWPPRRGRELRFALTPPSAVMGTLVDAATSRGIDGRVVLLLQGRFHHHVSKGTRARGTFRLVDLPAGSGVIYAYADGFAPHYDELTVEAGEQIEIRIGMLLGAAVSGSVLAADGSPVPHATVYVGYDESLPGAEILAGLAGGHVVTDEEGGFRVLGLVPDTPIALQAQLDGQLSDVATIRVGPGMERTGVVLYMSR